MTTIVYCVFDLGYVAFPIDEKKPMQTLNLRNSLYSNSLFNYQFIKTQAFTSCKIYSICITVISKHYLSDLDEAMFIVPTMVSSQQTNNHKPTENIFFI